MKVTSYKIRAIVPPKADVLMAIRLALPKLQEKDIVCISSKVVSIHEGRTIPVDEAEKTKLVKEEADWYLDARKFSKFRAFFTIAKGAMIGSSGIDESNGSGHYILYPKDPFKSARKMRAWLMKEYTVKELAVIICDSTSIPLRRGAIGFALSWDGLDPLRDYRGTKDIFGRTIKIEMANLADALAASAVLAMGEGNEQTPFVVIADAPGIVYKNRAKKEDQLIISPEEDIFAPLFWSKKWKRGRK